MLLCRENLYIFTWQRAHASKFALEVTKFYLGFRWHGESPAHPATSPPLLGGGCRWRWQLVDGSSLSSEKTAQSEKKKTPHKSSSSELEWGGEGKSLVSEAEAGERALQVGICFGCHGSEGIHSPACLCPAAQGRQPLPQ